MLLDCLSPVHFPGVSGFCRIQRSFFQFQGLAQAVADVVRLPAVAISHNSCPCCCKCNLVLAVVVAVHVILVLFVVAAAVNSSC